MDAVSYAMELAASCGGGTAAVSCEDKNTRNEQEDDRDILMYDIRDNELVILETTLSHRCFRSLWKRREPAQHRTDGSGA